MNKSLAAPDIDFADSEYKSLNMSEQGNLTIYLTSWDAKLIQITFEHVKYFTYTLGSYPSEIYEITDNYELEKILTVIYDKYRPDPPLKLFVLEDIDDFPIFRVVAESINVTKAK